MNRFPRLLPIVFSASLIFSAVGATAFSQERKKIVIAHRGSSGYLPEHTLEAKAMAYAYGADYLEQDLVFTKDEKIVVMHDHYLDRITDVAGVFPDRKRKDGRYYAIDFTLNEIRQLSVLERFAIKDGEKMKVFPARFPLGKSRFKVHTFEEEIEMIQGLNASTGKNVGIYPEVKRPNFHLEEGRDLSKAIIKVLKKYGYTKKSSKVFLQVFGFDEVKRISDKLFPELNVDVNLVYLIDGAKENDWVGTPAGMLEVAKYADGVGPSLSSIVAKDSKPGSPQISDFVKNAHTAGLVVHPYTFRIETKEIPAYAKDFNDLLDVFYHQADIDGGFTDFPDKVIGFLQRK